METDDMYKILQESGLFDCDFYLNTYKDVALSEIDPLTHYLDYGAQEGRNPNLLFNDAYYLSQCPELPTLGTNALAHYVLEGWHKLNPHPIFNTEFYLDNYPEVRSCGITPLAHYLKIGAYCAYDPCPEFDTSFYLAQDPQIRACGLNPLAHYVLYGRDEGLSMRNTFLDEFPDSLMESYELLTKLEPLLPKAELLADLPLVRFLKTSRTGDAYFKLIEGLNKPFSQLFIMPSLQSIGTQVYETLRNVIATHGSREMLLLLTDSTILEHEQLTGSNLTITTLCDPMQELTNTEKAKILLRLIIQASPHTVYNCASPSAKEAFNEFRKPLEHCTKLIDI